ncbi:MAG: phage minor head protein [Pseudomonadota bacterium]
MVTNAFASPFAEQGEFFRKKINLPSERWDDIQKSAHDRAFIVAGANKADLLNDLRLSIDQCIAEGKSLGWYQKQFDSIVKKHGWTGWTGEGSKAGQDWRTTITYQTNMSVSYAAGRWKQLHDPDLVKIRPYLTYHHADGVRRPRPLHLSWNGFTAPRDHPFWSTHACPNGWGCHCFISAASEEDYSAARAAGKHEPPDGWDKIDPKTGEPVGIDKGFGYAPGANRDKPLRKFVSEKLITYPPAISRALTKDINRYVETAYSPAEFAAKALADKSVKDQLWLGFVENSPEILNAVDINLMGYPVLLPANAVRHIDAAHRHDGAGQRAVLAADYMKVMPSLLDYDNVRMGDTVNGMQRLILSKKIEQEMFRWVFEIRPGKKNRTLMLISAVIKTGG